METFGSIFLFVAGFFAALMIEAFKRSEDRKTEARSLRRARVIQPIEAFVDDQLEMISEAYWVMADSQLSAEKNDVAAKAAAVSLGLAAVSDKLETVRNREASIAARVRGLGDPELTESFRKLSAQFINMRDKFREQGFGAGRQEMDKATALGAEVFERLWSDASSSARHPAAAGPALLSPQTGFRLRALWLFRQLRSKDRQAP